MGGDEEGSEVTKPLKVWPTVVFKLLGEVIQVGDTIFDDPEALRIKSLRTVEEIHDASADHSIECYQRPLMLASHSRPPLLLVGFPEGQHGISIHPEILYESAWLSSDRHTLAHGVTGLQAYRDQAPRIGSRCLLG
jgi:hypothetical protein